MKNKYVTLQVRIASLTKPATKKQNILEELEATIAERKKIFAQLESISKAAQVIDMYIHDNAA